MTQARVAELSWRGCREMEKMSFTFTGLCRAEGSRAWPVATHPAGLRILPARTGSCCVCASTSGKECSVCSVLPGGCLG